MWRHKFWYVFRCFVESCCLLNSSHPTARLHVYVYQKTTPWFRQSLGVLNLIYCVGRREVEFIIAINEFPAIQRTDTGSMWIIKGAYIAPRTMWKSKENVLITECTAICEKCKVYLSWAFFQRIFSCSSQASWSHLRRNYPLWSKPIMHHVLNFVITGKIFVSQRLICGETCGNPMELGPEYTWGVREKLQILAAWLRQQ